MKIGGYLLVALVSLAAGVGAGFAASGPGMLLLASAAAAPANEAEVQIEKQPERIDVTMLVKADEWNAARRIDAARQVDEVLLRNGYDVRVFSQQADNTVLEVRVFSFLSRLTAYKTAVLFDFNGLQKAGFVALLIRDEERGWGYPVAHAISEGSIMGPMTPEEIRDVLTE